MTGLRDRLRQAIRSHGPVSLADYMALCLTDPKDGYYTRSRAIGREGDFITAPEISQVFGELLGLAMADYWQRAGRPGRVRLVELGPGRGTLMADLLRAARMVPGFLAALEVHLVEVSPLLAARQAESLADSGKAPSWHESLAGVPTGAPLFLVANEFFDALPIRQFQRVADGWRERLVGVDAAGQLAFVPGDEPVPAPAHGGDAHEGAIVETCESGREIAGLIAARLEADGGLALIVDYGHGARAVGDTFQAVQGHRFADPLADPGKADLTAHVDFGALADAAVRQGARAWGPVGQGSLLGRLGLTERVRALSQGQGPEKVRDLQAGADRLAAPDQMGLLFKALALTHPDGPVPAGFEAPAMAETGP